MAHPWSQIVAEINGVGTARVGPATSRVTVTSGALSYARVSTSPVDLHRAAGLDRNVYAVARCVASEVGTSRAGEYLLAVAEAVRNEAKARDVEPYQLLVAGVRDSYAFTKWWYGEQHGRWASTSRDPTSRTVAAARAALEKSTDLCGGARRWISPRTSDSGSQGARAILDAKAIAEKWGAEGWEWIGPLPNVDSYDHAMFRKGSANKNAALVSLVEIGRAGGKTIGPASSDPRTAQVAVLGQPAWLLTGAAIAAKLAGVV